MANWFKLFETDLDETRMRFALTKLPEVWPVWTGILMECCKHRSDTIRWGDNEQELFGFADRLKISIPKVNEAIRILCDIDYVLRDNGHLKALKWNEKQDDYLARKSQGYWKNRSEAKKLTVNHSESHIEESIGEERRLEDKTTRTSPLARLREVFEAWNALGVVPRCLQISDKRRRALEIRLKEPFFSANWKGALEKVRASTFCQGGGSTGWKASFDWFIRPDSVTKIMEGNYDERKQDIRNGSKTHSLNPAADRRNAGTIGVTDYGEAGKRKLARQEAARLASQPPADEPPPSPA